MSSKRAERMKQIFAVCVVVVILACFVIYVCAPKEETLQLVHILFRHGERSPSESYNNDPYKDYKWPGGWDQLSINGKKQEYQLGLQLRQRYKNFLVNEYDPKTFLMESSYADRCLMSAQLLLAGLFPPIGGDVWNDDLLWQPIPVHSIPRYLDNKIAIKKNCPVFLQALNESYAGLDSLNLENRQLFDYLSENTGNEIRSIRTLETLYNTLEIEDLNGLDLPEWTLTVFPGQMKSLAAKSLALFTNTPLMKRLHGGVLAKEIVENMEAKRRNELQPTERKMIMYSGHDLTVVTLLRVFGFDELIKPDFGATIIVELHKFNSDEYVVKFFYMENPHSKPKELHLDGCDGDRGCDLSKLRQLIEPVLPANWEAECQDQ